MELLASHHTGYQNNEVAPRFLEHLSTPAINKFLRLKKITKTTQQNWTSCGIELGTTHIKGTLVSAKLCRFNQISNSLITRLKKAETQDGRA